MTLCCVFFQSHDPSMFGSRNKHAARPFSTPRVFTNYVPFIVPGLSTSSSTTPTPTSSSSSSQDSVFDESRHTENPVPGRSGSTSEELRGEPAAKTSRNRKQQNTHEGRGEVQCDLLHDFRISERIWSMKVVLQSHGETLRPRIKTLPVLLMN